MSANICLLALIGLPAAGKTSFSQWLLSYPQQSMNIIHLCYDNMLNITQHEQLSEFAYKLQRSQILKRIDKLVDNLKLSTVQSQVVNPDNVNIAILNNTNSTSKYLLICDDNNYYRSMRYKLYQLCRTRQISYAQIYFDCSLQDLTKRNDCRTVRDFIPPYIIERMSRRMEIPIPMKMKWEKNTYILEANKDNYEKTFDFLRTCFDNIPPPILPLSSNYNAKFQQSLLHKLDLLLRKKLHELLQNVSVDKPAKAEELNETRKEILVIFKNSISKSVPEEEEKVDHNLCLYVDLLF